MTRYFFLSFIIRVFLEGYFELTISSLLAFNQDDLSASGDMISYVSAMIFIFFLIIVPPAVLIGYHFNARLLPNSEIKLRYGSFYEDLKLKDQAALLYVALFMVRRYLLGLVLVFLYEHPTY